MVCSHPPSTCRHHATPTLSTSTHLSCDFCSQPEEEEEGAEPEAEAEATEAAEDEEGEGGDEAEEPVELPPVPEHQNMLVAHKMLAAILISEEEYLALKEIVRADGFVYVV